MASLRLRYKVWWNDGDEVEIRTTVADLISAVEVLPEDQRSNGIALTTAQIYCALKRLGHDVPSYEEWLLVLDNYDQMKTVVEIDGPTYRARLATVPSQLPSSQEPPGNLGLNQMIAP
jgi:hypothetical protein